MFITLISFTLSAQEHWTLKQCIEYGLKNNRNNTIYANQKKAADARAKEALAEYLPKIALTSTLDDNLRVQETIIPAGIFSDQDIRVAFTKKFQANNTAQLDQVIYDQSLLTGLKANKYNKEQAQLNLKQTQESIIYNISSAYFQISVYREQLELLIANKEIYRRQMEIFQLQVDKGVTLQKDLDKVTVDYNNNSSQIRVAESNLKLAENELKFEMGYPIENTLIVDTIDSEKVPQITSKLTDNAFSPSKKTEFQLSENKIRLLEIEAKRIRHEALPKLSAYARYGALGFGDTVGETYRELSMFSAIGLKLNIPILDFYRRGAQHDQAEIERDNAQEQLKIDEGRYKVDYQNAQTKIVEAQTNVENDRRNVTLAESVLQTTDLQFQKGVTNLTDWLNTQSSLRTAQNSYLNSLYNFYLATLDLEKAAGTLTEFYNSL
ncbi:TolC family protein [Flavobacterium psychrotrophum]|uniref:TolC family protein n=1 Tax=Flavobacterium psychrotrophum TaxID=2294119 RepID=UPI001F08B027|nr:TolC family protein [Flavobacterium psychrotrophum]